MDKKGALSALMRGLEDPFAYTVLVARQRRVKLVYDFSCQSGVTDKTLFAPADANLNNTVSLRRSAMPDDG